MRSTEPQDGTSTPDAERLLDSWKEISSYLGRAVRTVQTWEKEESLPIHRHKHRERGTVYAYASEIDAWREGRDEFAKSETTRPEGLHRRPWPTVAVVAALAIGVAVTWWLFGRSADSSFESGRSTLAFSERDWLLIADFDNRTGEALLDGTLEAAFSRDMANSRFVNVASPQRVADTLQLMGRPINTPLSTAVAREVAQRDGAIRGVLIGRVERFGSSYSLSVDLISPADGLIVASLSEPAKELEAILPALSRLSRRVRESLGELLPSIQPGGEELSKVSTPSLRALQLYTQADQIFVEQHLAGGGNSMQVAEVLLREAITEDPEFASAHTLLAWALRNQDQPVEESLSHAQRAVELLEHAAVAERYFIRGSFYQIRSQSTQGHADLEAALAQYQALLELAPGHFWALSNASLALHNLGRNREGIELGFREAELRPTDFGTVANAALGAVAFGDVQKIRLYAARAASLEDDSGLADDQYTLLRSFLKFTSIYALWVDGDIEEVLREVDRTADTLSDYTGDMRQELTLWLADAYLGLGMLERSSQIMDFLQHSARRAYREAAVARLRGDRDQSKASLQRRLTKNQRGGNYGNLVIANTARGLARLGFLAEAEHTLTLLSEVPGGRPHIPQVRHYVLAARGTLALARGSYPEAISQLEEGMAYFRDWPWQAEFLVNSQTLARAWQAQGNLARAITVLEEATLTRGGMMVAVMSWMSARLHLAALYREVGREREALEIEAELRRYCAYADPDLVILQELERRESVMPEQIG